MFITFPQAFQADKPTQLYSGSDRTFLIPSSLYTLLSVHYDCISNSGGWQRGQEALSLSDLRRLISYFRSIVLRYLFLRFWCRLQRKLIANNFNLTSKSLKSSDLLKWHVVIIAVAAFLCEGKLRKAQLMESWTNLRIFVRTHFLIKYLLMRSLQIL